jgi:hypothetical protein
MKHQSSSSSSIVVLSTIVVAFTILAIGASAQQQSNTCEIDGTTYFQGDIITTFQTRCGLIADYPCYCDPTHDPPVSCPYCSFALFVEGGDTDPDGNLLCLMDGESDSFTDIDGIDQTCSCAIDGGNRPISDCTSSRIADVPFSFDQQDGDSITIPADDNVCVIDLPDGTSRIFEAGEALGVDVLPTNRCGGDNFPCFCNPTISDNIECPYCRFPALDGDLICAKDGEIVTFLNEDGVSQECSCEISSDPTQGPIQDCVISEQDDTTPNAPDITTTTNNNNIEEDANKGFLPSSGGTGYCTLELESGKIVSVAAGESFGEYVVSRCGDYNDFPCYCNPSLPNQMECPYCGFVSSDGGLICAKDRDVLTFDAGGSIGTQTCSCEIPNDPTAKPIMDCRSVTEDNDDEADMANDNNNDDSPSNPEGGDDDDDDEDDDDDDDNDDDAVCSIPDTMGNIVTFEDGDSLGDLIEGVCGDTSEWPAYCNTDMVSVVSRQTFDGSDDDNNNVGIEYPYCIYMDSIDDGPICAKDNEKITYTNKDGDDILCSCVYLSAGLGGAQSNCSPVTDDSSTPTATTPNNPASTPTREDNQEEEPTSSPALTPPSPIQPTSSTIPSPPPTSFPPLIDPLASAAATTKAPSAWTPSLTSLLLCNSSSSLIAAIMGMVVVLIL